MFVRKGTVRKNRGTGRRQAHKHRRDSSEQSGVSRKSVIFDDPSSNGSVYGLSPNGDLCGSRSVSMSSFSFGTTLEPDHNGVEKEVIDNTLCNPYINRYRNEEPMTTFTPQHNYKSAIVVSFDSFYRTLTLQHFDRL
jgi:hypothetical protein